MKTLCLIRHAKSSWEDPSQADMARPLNKRGKRDAPIMAKELQSRIPSMDIFWCSSARRTLDTMKYFIEVYTHEHLIVEHSPELYLCSAEEQLNIIRAIDDSHNKACVFGHNPTTTLLANMYNLGFIDNVPTCGIVIIRSNAETWKTFRPSNSNLDQFLYPKLFL